MKAKALLYPYKITAKKKFENVEIDINNVFINMYHGPIIAYKHNDYTYRIATINGKQIAGQPITDIEKYFKEEFNIELEKKNSGRV